MEAVVAAAGGAGASSTELSLVPAFEARNPAPLDTRTAFHLSETNALTWDSTVMTVHHRHVLFVYPEVFFFFFFGHV